MIPGSGGRDPARAGSTWAKKFRCWQGCIPSCGLEGRLGFQLIQILVAFSSTGCRTEVPLPRWLSRGGPVVPSSYKGSCVSEGANISIFKDTCD